MSIEVPVFPDALVPSGPGADSSRFTVTQPEQTSTVKVRKPHRLYLRLDTESVGVRIVCPGDDDPDRDCRMFSEGDTCQCAGFTNTLTGEHVPCEDCESDDHGCCGGDWPSVAEMGPGCKLVLVVGCGVTEYLCDLSIEEMLHGAEADWKYAEDGAALAQVTWRDDYPTLEPWSDV